MGLSLAVVVGVGDECDVGPAYELSEPFFAGDVEDELSDVARLFDHEIRDRVEG